MILLKMFWLCSFHLNANIASRYIFFNYIIQFMPIMESVASFLNLGTDDIILAKIDAT